MLAVKTFVLIPVLSVIRLTCCAENNLWVPNILFLVIKQIFTNDA